MSTENVKKVLLNEGVASSIDLADMQYLITNLHLHSSRNSSLILGVT